ANGPATGGIERGRLGHDLQVVNEAMPHLRSVAVGLWIGTGGIDEPGRVLGASHFLEHLGFKGTDRRSAHAIASAIESVGGDMNAFTAHELTCFHVRVPDEHLELALDILADVVWSPALRAEDVDAEREVILEELHMRDDQPDDLAHENFMEAVFPEHPLGRPVLGTTETIAAMSRDDIAAYHRDHYLPTNTVLSVAGNTTHDTVCDLVAARLPERTGDRPPRTSTALSPVVPLVVTRRPSEQAHLVLGHRSLRRDDPDRYALAVLNQAFGGGMASRLFQEVREQRGLAYSVYSYRSAYAETGAYSIYVGTGPDKAQETLTVVRDLLDDLVANGLTDHEVDEAKGALRGATALGLESSSSRMHRLGRTELVEGEVPTLDDLQARVAAVTPDDVRRAASRLLEGPQVLSVVGPFDEADFADRVA
ncbi:MAG: M16 family metallopeptidase, partial [Actinomycetes bacterium]